MALYDTIHLPYLHDDKDTVRRTILAGNSFAVNTDNHIYHHHMDSIEDIQNRHSDVWQETKSKRDLEVDEILR